MNRLYSPASPPASSAAPKSPAPATHVEPIIEEAVLRVGRRNGLPFSLFTPLHYERNYAYPLIVWLHGPQDDELQLHRVMPLLSTRNYAAVAPRGSCQHPGGQRGYHWGRTDDALADAEDRVFECIATAREKLNVAPDRVFLAGYDCGGSMAFRVALRNPAAFGGVLSVGGPFPLGQSPLANLSRCRRLPLFVAQGRDSKNYPIDRVCEELRLFHSAGMHVTLRQYPCGDELTTQMLHDIDVWIMERVTGQKLSTEESPLSTTELN